MPSRSPRGLETVIALAVIACFGAHDAHAEAPRTLVLEVVQPVGATRAARAKLMTAAEEAAASWRAPCAALEISVVPASERTPGSMRDGKDTLVVLQRVWCLRGVPSGLCYRRNELAVTTVFPRAPLGPRMPNEADVELNGVGYDWLDRGRGEPPPMELDAVLAHEFGHVLGLDHQTGPNAHDADGNPRTIMTEGVHLGREIVRRPTRADLEMLCDLYPREEHAGAASSGAAHSGSGASVGWLTDVVVGVAVLAGLRMALARWS